MIIHSFFVVLGVYQNLYHDFWEFLRSSSNFCCSLFSSASFFAWSRRPLLMTSICRFISRFSHRRWYWHHS